MTHGILFQKFFQKGENKYATFITYTKAMWPGTLAQSPLGLCQICTKFMLYSNSRNVALPAAQRYRTMAALRGTLAVHPSCCRRR